MIHMITTDVQGPKRVPLGPVRDALQLHAQLQRKGEAPPQQQRVNYRKPNF
jgi:hypothetical protein